MSKNRVQEISDRFVKASIDSPEKYMKGNYAGGDRAHLVCRNCYCEFRDLGEDSLAVRDHLKMSKNGPFENVYS